MTKKTNKKNPDNLFQRNGVWWIRYNAGGKKQRKSLQTRSLKQAKQQATASRPAARRAPAKSAKPKPKPPRTPS